MGDSSSGRDALNDLAHDFAERYRRGERPDITEYAQRHPELADEIRELFPALLIIEEFGSAGGPVADSLSSRNRATGPAPKQLGEYRILREVARGGMGIVYEAVQESLGRHVALKVLPCLRPLDNNYLERFRREAKTAALLHHSNIVPVFGVGEHEGTHFLAMQFIQGQSLDSVLRELRQLRKLNAPAGEPVAANRALSVSVTQGLLSGQFAGDRASAQGAMLDQSRNAAADDVSANATSDTIPSASAVGAASSSILSQSATMYFRSIATIGIQVAEALSYAHQQGVLHRDIKPANLLLDTRGTVWVTDFGLAKAEGSEHLTSPGDIVGTIRYMAPERFQGKSDRYSDIFSLGLTLYELATLQPAFAASERAQLIERMLNHEPPPPCQVDPRIPRDFETIILKAIAKNPKQRYATAAELAEDLRRLLSDRPIQARRATARERIWRWCRRNPLAASLLTLILVLALTVAAVSTGAAFRLDQALTRLTDAEQKTRLREADALVGQAAAKRLSQRSGQRFDALDALGKAATIGRELQQPAAWFDRLRYEAIAALALPDIHITQEWPGFPPGHGTVAMSGDFAWYARTTDRGQCTIVRAADQAVIAQLKELGESVNAEFGASMILAVHGAASHRLQLWDIAAADDPALRCEIQKVANWAFHPKGHLLGCGHDNESIQIYDTATGESRHQLASPKAVRKPALCFHPSEPLVCISSYHDRPIQVVDYRTGILVASATSPHASGGAAWSRDGHTLVVPQSNGGTIRQYTFDPESPELRLKRTIVDADVASGASVTFNPAGDRFVCRGWNGVVTLHDAGTGVLLSKTHGQTVASERPLRFDLSGQRLAGARIGDREDVFGMWSIADAREFRRVLRPTVDAAHNDLRPAVHPNGRLAACGFTDHVALFDLELGLELARLPSKGRFSASVCFDGAGNLVANGFAGMFRWPIRADSANSQRLHVGPPERLPFYPGNRTVAVSQDGRVIAQPMYDGYDMSKFRGGWVLAPGQSAPRRVGASLSMGEASVSPDGRWIAFGRHQHGIYVYEAATGQCKWQSPLGTHSFCRFSSDGRSLVTDVDGGRVYAVDSWQPGPQLGAGTPWDATPHLAVVGQPNGVYRLMVLDTGREVARLEDPDRHAGAAAFTPDGTKLVIAAPNGLRVWDLRRLRAQLDKLGLDWDAPSFPAEDAQCQKAPLECIVDAGLLIPENPRLAIIKYTFALAVQPLNPQAYVRRGSAHHELHQWAEAIRDFDIALALLPIDHDPTLWSKRATAHQELGHWSAAAADFSKVIELMPHTAEAWQARATDRFKLKQWEDAAKDFSKAIELQRGQKVSARVYHDSAFACMQAGQYQKAIAGFKKAVEENPNFALALNNHAWLLVTCSQESIRDPAQALALAKKAVALSPNTYTFSNTLGVVHYRLGNWQDAIQALQRSMDFNHGGTAFDYFFLAMAHRKLGHADEARLWYDRGLAWLDKNQELINEGGNQWAKLGRFRIEAEELLKAP
jgi:serine/threonine protein kinase/Tfp pilus assembly protein PilF/WD40 repeat protein